MSGYNREKINRFYQYCEGMVKGENGRQLFEKHRNILETITPRDIMVVFHMLTEKGFNMEDIKTAVNKILHTVYLPLKNYKMPEYSKNGLIDLFIKDNREMEKRLNDIKPLIKKINKEKDRETQRQLLEKFREIEKFITHYIAKENIIFPILEKKSEYFGCTQIMWSFDDDIKNGLKQTLSLLENSPLNLKEFNIVTGKLFFNMFAISFRENKILFPFMLETIEEEELNQALFDLKEIGLPFVEIKDIDLTNKKKKISPNTVDLNTGNLTPEQIILIFNHLPVDITFVDENNEVKYFSTPKHRIFPRTKAVLGRKVQNCHPPESIDTVNKIVESFKKGEKDSAEFWINYKGKFLFIRYFAVRDEKGRYKGTLEVSQDITDIKKLQGEKRLLDWEE